MLHYMKILRYSILLFPLAITLAQEYSVQYWETKLDSLDSEMAIYDSIINKYKRQNEECRILGNIKDFGNEGDISVWGIATPLSRDIHAKGALLRESNIRILNPHKANIEYSSYINGRHSFLWVDMGYNSLGGQVPIYVYGENPNASEIIKANGDRDKIIGLAHRYFIKKKLLELEAQASRGDYVNCFKDGVAFSRNSLYRYAINPQQERRLYSMIDSCYKNISNDSKTYTLKIEVKHYESLVRHPKLSEYTKSGISKMAAQYYYEVGCENDSLGSYPSAISSFRKASQFDSEYEVAIAEVILSYPKRGWLRYETASKYFMFLSELSPSWNKAIANRCIEFAQNVIRTNNVGYGDTRQNRIDNTLNWLGLAEEYDSSQFLPNSNAIGETFIADGHDRLAKNNLESGGRSFYEASKISPYYYHKSDSIMKSYLKHPKLYSVLSFVPGMISLFEGYPVLGLPIITLDVIAVITVFNSDNNNISPSYRDSGIIYLIFAPWLSRTFYHSGVGRYNEVLSLEYYEPKRVKD
jgi:hypothetical protein